MAEAPRIAPDTLRGACTAILHGLGVPTADAELVAHSLVEADLRGWLPVMGVILDDAVIEQILTEAEDALGQYVTADGESGEMVFAAPAHIVTAQV